MSLLPGDKDAETRDEPIDFVTRDYLLFTIFVLVQHGYYKRAAILSEALAHAGDRGIDLVFARMAIRFFSRDWSGALALAEELERRDPAERFGHFKLSDRQKMRRYVRLRCLHELGETAHVRDAIEIYLRHGDATGNDGA
jgi:hypothetical protein